MKSITVCIGRIVMTLWWGMWGVIAFGFIVGMWAAWLDKLPIHAASSLQQLSWPLGKCRYCSLRIACFAMRSGCGIRNDREQPQEDPLARRQLERLHEGWNVTAQSRPIYLRLSHELGSESMPKSPPLPLPYRPGGPSH